jgi:hypothetical protein
MSFESRLLYSLQHKAYPIIDGMVLNDGGPSQEGFRRSEGKGAVAGGQQYLQIGHVRRVIVRGLCTAKLWNLPTRMLCTQLNTDLIT